MTIQLNKEAYQELINQDIQVLDRYMPEYSLERKHITDVLNWSVNQIYPDKKSDEPVAPTCRLCESNKGVKVLTDGHKHCLNCGNYWL